MAAQPGPRLVKQYRGYASPQAIAISKLYLLTYRDGTRRHISRQERDSLLYSQSIRCTGTSRYLYTAPSTSFRLTATSNTLNQLAISTTPATARRYLGGRFIVELKGKRIIDIPETPEYLGFQLSQTASANVASAD